MNTKLFIAIYLIMFALISVYLPEYIETIFEYQDQISSLLKNSSTAFITKGS